MSAALERAAAVAERERVETPFQRFVSEFAESKLALLGLAVFTIIAVVAILAPFIAPQNPYDLAVLDIMDGRLEPGSVSGDGATTYWLGTDDQGRDMLSGIMYGLRISLTVGAGSALPSCAWWTCSSPSPRSWSR
jgi:peptide/nickel transport system permease protein